MVEVGADQGQGDASFTRIKQHSYNPFVNDSSQSEPR